MGRVCAVRGCGKIPDRRTCHRLPLRYSSRLKLWLSFLGFDTNTPIHVLEEADHRVCALHFRFEDYVQSTKNSKRVQSPKKLYLKRTAVPTLLGPPQDEENIGVSNFTFIVVFIIRRFTSNMEFTLFRSLNGYFAVVATVFFGVGEVSNQGYRTYPR